MTDGEALLRWSRQTAFSDGSEAVANAKQEITPILPEREIRNPAGQLTMQSQYLTSNNIHNSMRLQTILTILMAVSLILTVEAKPEPAAEKCKVYLLCDDEGELFINGVSTLKTASYNKIAKAEIPLKKGDVITLIATDAQGGPGGLMAILITKNDAPVLKSKDFRYATKPRPNWQTDKSLSGFRKAKLSKLKGFSLGYESNQKSAWSQASDRNHGTLLFKSVMP